MVSQRAMWIWTPRIFGFVVVVLIFLVGVLDLGDELHFWMKAMYIATALLPTFAVVLAIYLGWRHPMLGGALLFLYGIIYAAINYNHLGWIMIISIPLMLEGILFMVSSRYHK